MEICLSRISVSDNQRHTSGRPDGLRMRIPNRNVSLPSQQTGWPPKRTGCVRPPESVLQRRCRAERPALDSRCQTAPTAETGGTVKTWARSAPNERGASSGPLSVTVHASSRTKKVLTEPVELSHARPRLAVCQMRFLNFFWGSLLPTRRATS